MKQIIFLSIILTVLCNTSIAQNVNIPDPNFKSILINDPSINTNSDNEIQLTEASSFNGIIYATACGISNMIGLEAFTALTALDCTYNQFTVLDLSENIALQTLYCGNNYLLTSLNVSSNINLQILDCSDCSLSTLNVSANINLQELDCSNCSLSTLNVSANSALHTLWCNDNYLTSLNINGNTLLSTLNCDNNLLTNINFSTNSALIYLLCGHNLLTTLDVFNNIDLEEIDCQNNQLTALNISTNAALQYLICSNNLMTNINVSTNLNLKQLMVENNQLTNLNVSNHPNLYLLYCDSNQITSLNITNTILIYFHCSHNLLTSLNTTLFPNVIRLYCNHNLLTSLDFSGNSDLQNLECNNNLLTNLNIKNGNNSILGGFVSNNNPNLFCIQVDNTAWSIANWTQIDTWANFSENCLLGTEQTFVDSKMNIFPNPSNGNFNISYSKTENLQLIITNYLGEIVYSQGMDSDNAVIDLSAESNGIYFYQLQKKREYIKKGNIYY